LLPYWKAQGRLNGKWVVTWKRQTLDHMVDLLDNDGIGIEKWAAGESSEQALDGQPLTRSRIQRSGAGARRG
jgi:hypothetical protein